MSPQILINDHKFIILLRTNCSKTTIYQLYQFERFRVRSTRIDGIVRIFAWLAIQLNFATQSKTVFIIFLKINGLQQF